jgi:hypothetical protein
MWEFEIELKLKEMKQIIDDMLDAEFPDDDKRPTAQIVHVYILDTENQMRSMWQTAIRGKSPKKFNNKLQGELMETVGERVEIFNISSSQLK